MTKKDITFKNEDLQVKFNFRVAGIFVNNDKILLQKNEKDNYWSLIGGRVNYFENTKEAFIREVKEETGILLKIDELELIDVVENFFKYDNTKFHEILFIYKILNNKQFQNKNHFKTLDKNSSINHWVNISELNKYEIMPNLVKDIIQNKEVNHDIIKNY